MSKNKEIEFVCWTLETLPVEMLLKIFSYLSARTLYSKVSLVSTHFNHVIKNEKTWKIRHARQFGGFPYLSGGQELEDSYLEKKWYSRGCVLGEELRSVFSQNCTELSAHIACVDSVHFIKDSLLASGSRDRSICIFDARSKSKLYSLPNAHKGWIWSLGSDDTSLYSASWDTMIKSHDIETKQCKGGVKLSSAILSMSGVTTHQVGVTNNKLLAAGLFDRKIYMVDKTSNEIVFNYRVHRKSVLAVGVVGNFVISASEDGRLVKYCLRKRAVQAFIRFQHFPKCISGCGGNYQSGCGNYQSGCDFFYVGDIKGNLHLVDFEKFVVVKSFPSLHKRAVQGVGHHLGGVVTCGSDGAVVLMDLTIQNIRNRVQVGGNCELPSVAFGGGNKVAVAGGDSIVRLWTTF